MSPAPVDATHDPALKSWVPSAQADDSDFPIQNLPFGRFRRAGEGWRLGVAIGDRVLDLRAAGDAGLPLPPSLAGQTLNGFMAEGAAARRAVRARLSQALAVGSADEARLRGCLVAQADVELGVPASIGDYTDFYTGIHHATAVGKLFRPDNPLLPNYKWVPIGYHGRASSIVASGATVMRPHGQLKGEGETPVFAPTRRLDYELEVGVFVGAGNALGRPLSMDAAEADWFGMVLLNDWSARDVQAWEYQPLGPFLAKSFASTLSPWVVTQEALAPYRVPFTRPAGDPQPLPHLDSAVNRERGGIDVTLEVWLQPCGAEAQRLSCSNLRHAYWTVAQMLAHHASNGCNLQPGDLLGSGTQSGPGADEGGSLLELTDGGRRPLALAGDVRRTFLEDGDRVVFRAHAARAGFARIGFGECAGTVVPGARP